jgi:ferritin
MEPFTPSDGSLCIHHSLRKDDEMLNKTLLDALNTQINHELYSAYLYLSMATHFESKNLPGFARWMHIQNREETKHAMKFYKYIYDRGGAVTLIAIAQPPTKFKTPLEIFEEVLEHEQKVTGLINKLYELALTEKDYATQSMLQWFIDEQVEEEKSAAEIIAMLKMIGDSQVSLLMADQHLGARKGE